MRFAIALRAIDHCKEQIGPKCAEMGSQRAASEHKLLRIVSICLSPRRVP
jgi:hypothetical protein